MLGFWLAGHVDDERICSEHLRTLDALENEVFTAVGQGRQANLHVLEGRKQT